MAAIGYIADIEGCCRMSAFGGTALQRVAESHLLLILQLVIKTVLPQETAGEAPGKHRASTASSGLRLRDIRVRRDRVYGSVPAGWGRPRIIRKASANALKHNGPAKHDPSGFARSGSSPGASRKSFPALATVQPGLESFPVGRSAEGSIAHSISRLVTGPP